MMAANAEIGNLAHQIRNNPEFAIILPKDFAGSNQYLFSYLRNSGYFNRLLVADRSGATLLLPLPDVQSRSFFTSIYELNVIPDEVTAQLFHQGPLIHNIVLLSDSLQPAVFIYAPVLGFNGESALLLEVSLSEINRILLENDPMDGPGESGESYIVGADTLMISQSRFRLHRGEKFKVNTRGYKEAAEGRAGASVINVRLNGHF